jgi:hypothetical protein
MELRRFVNLWLRGRTAIRMGLLCSFLTCLAGTLLNALFESHLDVLGPAGMVRRLVVGYVGATAVVVLAFPFLSGGPRERDSDDDA